MGTKSHSSRKRYRNDSYCSIFVKCQESGNESFVCYTSKEHAIIYEIDNVRRLCVNKTCLAIHARIWVNKYRNGLKSSYDQVKWKMMIFIGNSLE